jgi:hypothetical protein
MPYPNSGRWRETDTSRTSVRPMDIGSSRRNR